MKCYYNKRRGFVHVYVCVGYRFCQSFFLVVVDYYYYYYREAFGFAMIVKVKVTEDSPERTLRRTDARKPIPPST